MPQLCRDDLIEAGVAVEVEVVGSSQQVHGEDQAHETEVMIAMQVADENVIDAVQVRLETHELHLRSFPAVNQKMPVLDLYKLCGGKPSVSRKCAAGTEYGDVEAHAMELFSNNEQKRNDQNAGSGHWQILCEYCVIRDQLSSRRCLSDPFRSRA